MPSLQGLGPWHDFYTLLGATSATMVGLLFVAASLGTGIFSRDRRAASRMFLSATVVNFASIIAVCLTALSPVADWSVLGGIILCCGLFGLGYSAIAWHGAVRDGISAKIDFEDRVWYAALPAVGYFVETGCGGGFCLRLPETPATIAVSMAGLLMVGIHNAWDITIWSVTRPRD